MLVILEDEELELELPILDMLEENDPADEVMETIELETLLEADEAELLVLDLLDVDAAVVHTRLVDVGSELPLS